MSSADTEFAESDSYFAETFGLSVTYVRGEDETTLTAEVELNDYQIMSEDGIATTAQIRDYLITASDLGITPRSGDKIKQTIDSVVHFFQVMPLDEGPVYKEVDTIKSKILIHTKYIGTE